MRKLHIGFAGGLSPRINVGVSSGILLVAMLLGVSLVPSTALAFQDAPTEEKQPLESDVPGETPDTEQEPTSETDPVDGEPTDGEPTDGEPADGETTDGETEPAAADGETKTEDENHTDAGHKKDDDSAGDHKHGEDHADGDDHAGGHDDDHAETGVPMSFREDLALWSLVTFVIFLFVLRTFAWGPLTSGLDKRESNIRKDIADAQADRQKAQQLLTQHQQRMDEADEEVRGIIAKAHADAEQVRTRILADAEAEATAKKERAEAEIERARDAALKEIFTSVNDRVADATELVLGRALNEGDQDRLINEALQQLSTEA